VAELPEDIRRDLPKLVVSGSVYSSNPAQRMLVLNGLVVQEGGTPHNDVVLEQIRPKSAVLLFKGYRYKLDF
jgi:general secretion pathway protein B